MTETELKRKISAGELDVNAQKSFFSIVTKGFLRSISDKISIRGVKVPHMIVNTGDDTMYLESKGQDMSIEPYENSNESYVYNVVPRAVVTPGGVNILGDQLTIAAARGMFDLDIDGGMFGLTAEFRRMPVEMSIEVKYFFDSFSDVLDCTQQMLCNLAFITSYSVEYMGQKIMCAYTLSDSIDREIGLEFDGLTAESKHKTIDIEYKLETNLPVFDNRTVMMSSDFISVTSGRTFGKSTLSSSNLIGISGPDNKILSHEVEDIKISKLVSKIEKIGCDVPEQGTMTKSEWLVELEKAAKAAEKELEDLEDEA